MKRKHSDNESGRNSASAGAGRKTSGRSPLQLTPAANSSRKSSNDGRSPCRSSSSSEKRKTALRALNQIAGKDSQPVLPWRDPWSAHSIRSISWRVGSRRLKGIRRSIHMTEGIGSPAHTLRYAAISGRRVFYATSLGTTSSINRRNRGLRPPATNDTCETSAGPAAEVFAFAPAFHRDRLLCVPATKITKQHQSLTSHPRVAGCVCISPLQARWKQQERTQRCGIGAMQATGSLSNSTPRKQDTPANSDTSAPVQKTIT
ncbi:hypothetical protein SAMN04488117_105220 [Celeribacter baekdonensis]|uniref:Uncharacterized protein n=1 Tax=Celeribacter baekdonensis TaxID=875171 RepID=A0A1G7MG47_9RHOB|nr:hypothetical protein SAMN04488117_105220 [Celeribacter baekdonensis]